MSIQNFKRTIKKFLGDSYLPPRVVAGLPGEKILVLAPHPDDEVLGCGGSLLKLVSGQAATIVFLTNGARGDPLGKHSDIVRVREEEARAAWSAVPGIKLEFLGLPDGKLLAHESEAVEKISALGSFDTILAPSFSDRHPDHRAAAKIAVNLAGCWRAKILFYEVWSTLPVNLIVDISGTIENKRKLINSYQSQLGYQDLIHPMFGLNAYRTMDSGDEKIHYAEGFLALSHKEAEDFVV
jgi:LmbE family N-acetylglucosaminyl deacetylase